MSHSIFPPCMGTPAITPFSSHLPSLGSSRRPFCHPGHTPWMRLLPAQKQAVNFGSQQHGCKHAAWCLSSILLAQHPQDNNSEKYNQELGNHCTPPTLFLNMAIPCSWGGRGVGVTRRREQRGEQSILTLGFAVRCSPVQSLAAA